MLKINKGVFCMSNYSYMKKQTVGIARHNYSTFELRRQAMTEQSARIKRNVESGDLTEKQARQLLVILDKGI